MFLPLTQRQGQVPSGTIMKPRAACGQFPQNAQSTGFQNGRNGRDGTDGRNQAADSPRAERDQAARPIDAGRRGRGLRIDRRQQFEKGRARQRRREHIALRRADAALAQRNHLLERLDALGDDVHAHVARKIDQGFDDGHRGGFVPERVDEHLVDLDDVDAELEHVGQTGMPCPDVVDRNLDSQSLQSRDHAAGRCQAVERLTLGDFKHNLRQPASASLQKSRAHPKRCRRP